MIGLELAVRCDAGNRPEFLPTLQNLSLEAAAEDSCHECRVFQDLGTANRFIWVQWWRSEGQLESYMRSQGFRTLMGAVKVLGALDAARIVELQDSTSVLGALVGGRDRQPAAPISGSSLA